MRPPLSGDEVRSVIKGLEKKDYEYKCNDQPMQSHCDSVKCRSRKFGVGNGGAYPKIEKLSKLDTQPPLWFVDIPGAHIPMRTEQLTNYRRFHTLCVEYANIVFRIIPDVMWMVILSEAMQDVNVMTAPPDVGREGIFLELMTTFLTQRTVGQVKEDLLRGVPWLDEKSERYYFQLAAFQKFLSREGVKNLDRPEISDMIRRLLNGEPERMSVKHHRNLYMWFVPSLAVERAATLDPPKEEREEL
jgi:hypothetical protein